MIGTDYIFGTRLQNEPSSVILDFDAATGYDSTNNRLVDSVEGRYGNLSASGMYNSAESSILTDAENESIELPNSLPINKDFTMSFLIRLNAWNGYGNPGFHRITSGDFFILEGTTGRPWVRISGIDVIKEGAGGYAFPQNSFIYITQVVKSHTAEEQGYSKILVDGVSKVSVNHTKSVASTADCSFLIRQANTRENIFADTKRIIIHNKALSESEVLSEYQSL